jgi:hypothetical protein
MKNALLLLGLIFISVLYMFEVNYRDLGTLNWIAFAVIFLTFLYVIISVVIVRERNAAAREQKKKDEKFVR